MTNAEYQKLFAERKATLSHEKPVYVHPNMEMGRSVKEAHTFFFPTYGYEKSDTIAIETMGKTMPDPAYYIQRNDSNYYILELVIAGKGYLCNDGEYYTLTKDCVYLLRPHSNHIYFSDKDDPYEKVWLNFFCSTFEPLLKMLRLDQTVYYDVTCQSKFFELYNLLMPRYSVDFNKINTYKEIYIDTVKIIFDILLSLAKSETKAPSTAVEQTLKSILDTGMYQKINISEIARSIGFSSQSLSYKFKKAYGVSPYKYSLDLKIEAAKEMLMSTNLPVNIISEKLRFPDPFYFSNVFTQKTGMRPKLFRQQYNESVQKGDAPTNDD